MDSRERILKSFNHEEPDRVPIFFQSIMPNFFKKLEQEYEDKIEDDDIIIVDGKDFTLYKKLGVDMAWGCGGSLSVHCPTEILKNYPLPKLEKNDEYVDIDGRVHRKTKLFNYDYNWYLRPYLTNEDLVDEWYENYFNCEWDFNPNAPKLLNQQLKMYQGKFVPTCGLHAIFEPIWEGIGLALFAKLLRKNKSKIKKYIDLRTKHAVQQAKIAAEADFDVYNLCDDSAFKQNTMIDPKIHRELIIPAYKKIVNELKKVGKKVFFHSDGYTEPYFEGLIEAGFDGVESLEPASGMNLKKLKEKYGDKLCLIGNIDVSELLPMRSKDDVRKEVIQCIKDAAVGGGYILSPCTDITDSCKFENVLEMIETVKKFGNYPISL